MLGIEHRSGQEDEDGPASKTNRLVSAPGRRQRYRLPRLPVERPYLAYGPAAALAVVTRDRRPSISA
jgi:hypothetical protein